MEEYNSLRSQDMMTTSIYNFLDNLLAAVRTSETLASEAQERDQINVANDIKPGGYSEDIFIFLSEREKEEYFCSVCYSVIKDVHQCSNGHKFCYSCIYVWSSCNRAGADCCPACRCEGIYARNEQLNEKIGGKRVKCQDEGCNWRGFLRDYSDHEHRHYEFKELSRSIELPSLKLNELPSVISPPPLLPLDLIEDDKSINNTTENQRETNDLFLNQETITNSNRVNISRSNSVPRRLSRPSENVGNTSRAFASRPHISNYTRSSHCPVYRQGINYPPRPPRLSRISRTNEIVASPRNTDANVNHNESTQTIDRLNLHSPILSSLLDSSSRESSNLFPRTAHGARDHLQSPLFPSINPNSRNNLASSNNERQRMEYRRLAPTYASRRNNNVSGLMTDGREHLAMMLILLTSDLEDRITVSNSSNSHSRDNLNQPVNNTATNLAASLDTSRNRHSSGSSNSTSNNSSRLQEFRNLNRRLSEVANSLDILIESTSRHGETVDSSTARSSSDSSTFDNSSDRDE